MTCEFAISENFRRLWRMLGLNDHDLRELEYLLMQNIEAGKVMPGCGGARKIRFAPSWLGKGKSGGLRVVYSWHARFSHVLLIVAYTKSKQKDIRAGERKAISELIAAYEAELVKRFSYENAKKNQKR